MSSAAPPLTKSEGGVAGTHDVVDRLPVVAAPATSKEFNTVTTALIPIACWRVDDIRFRFGSSFVEPEVSREIGALKELREQHKLHIVGEGAETGVDIFPRISIFGHADPTGNDDYNKQLSGRRATAIYGLLTRDTSLWEQLFSNPLGDDHWGQREIGVMLDTLGFAAPSSSSGSDAGTHDALRAFQASAGLPATGQASSTTRSKLFLAYMDQLCGKDFKLDKADDFLAGTEANGKGDYQGCSEFNPVLIFSRQESEQFSKPENKTTRDTENAPNRRVMVLLFQPGAQVLASRWPCPTAKEGTAGCRKRFWSDGEQRRSKRLEDKRREFRETADTFACRFYHRLSSKSPCEQLLQLTGAHISVLLRSNSGAVPIASAKCKIFLDDGRVLEGQTDADGFLEHQDVAPGDYELEVNDKKVGALVPTIPKHLDRRVLRLPEFFLFDNQPPGDSPAFSPDEDLLAEGGESSSEMKV